MKDLRTLREEKNLTQAELATRAGINKVTFNNIENHKTTPHASVRHNIELKLRQRVNWLTTCGLGLDRGKKEVWEDIEANLRKVITNANMLSVQEREQFIAMAKAYIRSFERYIEIDDDAGFTLPPDTGI
jgi:DNA-binding XRE family transcriptional regulator